MARTNFEYVSKGAHAGAAECQDLLGIWYFNGNEEEGIEQNHKAAVEWFEKAAAQGFAKAQYHLGECYENGIGGLNRDSAKAAELWEQAAKQGQVDACRNLGFYYYPEARNVKRFTSRKAIDQATVWFEKAAQMGDAESQFMLGVCYMIGKGQNHDPKKAMKWFELAAKQYHPDAQYNLGVCYADGLGGLEQNQAKAITLWKQAALNGSQAARFALSVERNCSKPVKNNPMVLLEDVQRTCLEYMKDKVDIENNTAATKAFFNNYLGRNYFVAGEKTKIVTFDYEDDLQAAYYMLKYGNYYAFEYVFAYSVACALLMEQQPSVCKDGIRALSFGCGTMLDALSLDYVLKQFRNCDKTIEALSYAGVDICEWADQTKIDFSKIETENNKFIFKKCSMENYWDQDAEYDCNVLFFPKVLGELPENVIAGFCRGLATAMLKSDVIILSVSYPGKKAYEKNSAYTKRIVQALEKNGYRSIPYGSTPLSFTGYATWEWFFERDGDGLFSSVNDSYFNVAEHLRDYYKEFRVSKPIKNYLGCPGTIRRECPKFKEAEAAYKDNGERPAPVRICEKGCNAKCGFIPSPREKLNSGNDSSCFDVIVFKKERN